MESHDDQEHLRPLSSLSNAELLARLRQAAADAASRPADPNKQSLSEFLNEQIEAEHRQAGAADPNESIEGNENDGDG